MARFGKDRISVRLATIGKPPTSLIPSAAVNRRLTLQDFHPGRAVKEPALCHPVAHPGSSSRKPPKLGFASPRPDCDIRYSQMSGFASCSHDGKWPATGQCENGASAGWSCGNRDRLPNRASLHADRPAICSTLVQKQGLNPRSGEATAHTVLVRARSDIRRRENRCPRQTQQRPVSPLQRLSA